MGDYASIDSRKNKNKFVQGNFCNTPPYIHTSIRLNSERSVMERYPVRPFLRWSRVLLGALLVVQMAIAQTPEANVSAKSEAPMATDSNPDFLVAAIKPSDPNTSREGWSFESDGRHITCFNATLSDIIAMAYGIHSKQIVSTPEWFTKDRFDISGTPDLPGIPNNKQIQQMYQKLLANRFHLAVHHETRQMPIYAMTVAKGGPTLAFADPKETRSNTGSSGGSGFRSLKFMNISMAELALNLSFYEDRPIIDQTSLPGRYDFALKWTYDISMESESGMPLSLFTAIKEQLGLRLDAVKGPAPVLVVDQIEHPTAN